MLDDMMCPMTPSGRGLRCNFGGGSNAPKQKGARQVSERIEQRAIELGRPMPKNWDMSDIKPMPKSPSAPSPQATSAATNTDVTKKKRTILASSQPANPRLGGGTVLGGSSM